MTEDLLLSCPALRSINTHNETSQYTMETEFACKLPHGLHELTCCVTNSLSSISKSPAGQTLKYLDVIIGLEDMDVSKNETDFEFPALQTLRINTNRMTPSFWKSLLSLHSLRSLQMTCGDANYTERDFDQLFKCTPLLSKLTVTFSY